MTTDFVCKENSEKIERQLASVGVFGSNRIWNLNSEPDRSLPEVNLKKQLFIPLNGPLNSCTEQAPFMPFRDFILPLDSMRAIDSARDGFSATIRILQVI